MPEERLEHLALSDDSIYKSVSLTKGQVGQNDLQCIASEKSVLSILTTFLVP